MFNFLSSFMPNWSPATDEYTVINNAPKDKATPLVPQEVKITQNEQPKVITKIAHNCLSQDTVVNDPSKDKATPLVPYEVITTHNEQPKVINEIANSCLSQDTVVNDPSKDKTTPLVPYEVITTHNEQPKVINEIANSCLNEAFEDLSEHDEKGIETINRVLLTENIGKKAFKELLRSTIDATPEKQIDICSKLIKLPLNKKIDSIKAIEVIFWALQSLEVEKNIPTFNGYQYERWKSNFRDFYNACFQQNYCRFRRDFATSNEGNKDNLAGMLYILKETPRRHYIDDESLYEVYTPIILNILIRQETCRKEMRCFLLAEKRINKMNPFKLPKPLKMKIFNHLLNTIK